MRATSTPRASPSCEKLAAAEILDCDHDALNVGPPDPGTQLVGGLPHRRGALPKHRSAIVLPEGVEAVTLHAVRHQRSAIALECSPGATSCVLLSLRGSRAEPARRAAARSTQAPGSAHAV